MSHVQQRAAILSRPPALSVGVISWLLASPLLAWADATRFDIPAQPLPSALQAFAVQANMQLLYVYDAVANRRANAVRGNLDKHQALNLLLQNTGLRASYSAADVATIEAANATAPTNGAGDKDTSQIRLAASAMAERDRAQAQQSVVLEEVIVTSQKRAERLRDVPVPVTAVAAVALADKSQFRMQDYYAQVPGLAMTPNQFSGAPSLAIRGITSGDTTNPTVSITVDDVAFGSSTSIGGGYFAPDLDPSDLARVEVLRGPQGTLYGAASIGGLIKYVTFDPSTEQLEGRVQAGANGVAHGGRTGYNVSGGINVPLGDTVAIRLNAFTREEPGYVDSIRGAGERDVNQTRSSGAHLSALWRAGERFSLKLSALIQDNETAGATYVTPGPGVAELQQDFLPRTGWVERKFQAYTATALAKFDAVEITSVTGYSESELSDLLDYSALNGGFTQQIFGSVDTLNTDDTTTYKFSQEIRATAQLNERLELLVGGYYADEYSPYSLQILAADPDGNPFDAVIRSRFSSTFAEWAGFTALTYRFTDRFDLQVGGRMSHIEQTFKETDAGPLVPLAFGTSSPRVLPEAAAREHATTYLITPRFKFSPDVMLYARLASGYRPGGINQGELAGLPPRFSSDETLNYEVGLKAGTPDHKLFFDASVFYIDWRDLQLSLINPANGQGYFTNGSRAKSQGVELSMQLVPAEGLHIGGWLVWNEAVLTEAMPTLEQGGVNGPAGARLPFSSRFSASASTEYEFPLAQLTGVVGATVSHVGERIGTFIADDSAREVFPAYTKADVHAGVKIDRWTFDLYLNNVTDERGVLGGGNGTIMPTAFLLIQPRTVGLSIARTF